MYVITIRKSKRKGVRKYYIVAEGLLRDHFEQIINNLNKELGLVKINMKKPIEVIGGHIYILHLLTFKTPIIIMNKKLI